MKAVFTPVLVFLLALSAIATGDSEFSVAKIDYKEIDDLLLKVVLEMDGNQELGERYEAKKMKAKEVQAKMQAAIMNGEAVNAMEAAAGMMHDDADKEKVEQLCQKYLLELIERVFKDKYEIVFKDDYRSSLLYARSSIDDITIVIKQELLRAIPKN
ncbi:MAG: hypothetical protein ACSHYB_13840 [Roseibacillus sp.]